MDLQIGIRSSLCKITCVSISPSKFDVLCFYYCHLQICSQQYLFNMVGKYMKKKQNELFRFLFFFSGAVNGKLKSLIHKMPTKMGFLWMDFKHIFFNIFNPKINWFCIFIIYALNKCFLKSFLYMKRKWERFFLLQKLHISKNSKHFLFMHISLYKY